MRATMLLCTGLLTLIGTIPASATPVFDATQVVSQASINPIYMDLEGVEATRSALHKASDLIDEVENPSAALTRIKCGDVIMERVLQEFNDDAPQGAKKNRRNINADAKLKPIFHRLNSNSKELLEYSALGWDMSEKQAARKLKDLGKDPTFDGMHDAILAILIGLMEASRTENVGKDESITIAQTAARDKWLEVLSWDQPGT